MQHQHSPPAQTSAPATTSANPTLDSNQDRQSSLSGPAHRTEGPDQKAPPEEPSTYELGGDGHVVAGGDTLRKISEAHYGYPHYWQDIQDANPKRIFVDGTVWMVGDTLAIPVKNVPKDGPTEEVPAGGEAVALHPTQENTEFGVFLVYPDAYEGPLDASDGTIRLRQAVYDALMLGREQLAQAQAAVAVQQVRELTSYGLFDWAITDAEATSALQHLGLLPIDHIAGARDAIGTKHWTRLIENLPAEQKQTRAYAKVVAGLRAHMDGSTPSSDELRTWFDVLPDNELPALAVLMGMRFGFEVGGRDGSNWTAASLRRAWGVLEQLPPQHVQDNDMLDLFLRDQGGAGAGYYDPSDQSGVVGFGADLEETGSYGEIMVTDDEGNEVDVGLHSNVNLFNTVVRHEIGHAVDERLGVSTSYATTAANAGKWKELASESAFVDEVIAKAGGMSGHGYADAAVYERALRKAVADKTDFLDALQAIKADDDTVADDLAEPEADCGGPVGLLFTKAQWESETSPWYSNANRPSAGGRQFVEAYPGWFYSFDASTRVQRGISAYQWRAPGEWFAEVYACYYSDHDAVTGAEPGTRLRTRDTTTADWFDANVHNRASLPAETGTGDTPPTGGT